MKKVAFSVDKRGKVVAYETRRSYSLLAGLGNAYLGRWFRVPANQAREWIANGEAEQVPMYPDVTISEAS
jgi:hypothetical protein